MLHTVETVEARLPATRASSVRSSPRSGPDPSAVAPRLASSFWSSLVTCSNDGKEACSQEDVGKRMCCGMGSLTAWGARVVRRRWCCRTLPFRDSALGNPPAGCAAARPAATWPPCGTPCGARPACRAGPVECGAQGEGEAATSWAGAAAPANVVCPAASHDAACSLQPRPQCA